MTRRRTRRTRLGGLVGLAVLLLCGAGCFPEFDRDRLADAAVCEIPCEPGETCLADGGCAPPDWDGAATDDAPDAD
jgi:hypothetical protein